MKLFNSLALELSARCNRKCVFCPVAYNTRPRERMPEALRDKAVHELAELKYHGRVELYIYNEPLLEWMYLVQTMTMLRRLVPRCTLMLATNCDVLKKNGVDKVLALRSAGLNQLVLNCYSADMIQPMKQLLAKLTRDGEDVYAQGKHKQFHAKLYDKSSADAFGTGVFRLTNRAGNIDQFMEPTAEPLERMCTRPFRFFNINWQGEALVCCQDYHGHIRIGNLADSTLDQLWESPVLNTYREHLLRRDRSLPLCHVCDCHAGAYAHNVPVPDGPQVKPQAIWRNYRRNKKAQP